ncbi:NADPH:quinone oxidoreductase family protein [Reichenbachiella sp. MALMAid0571]|uniref:NADPH:quinone oxidoreductase family protein n=1 Tax=Reichenbachiella sp. MALMAid0571 TaxID=3143939 RepID=UPI0032DEA074
MKAVLCKSYGKPETLVIEETDSPTPGKGEVIITVKACGLNFPDTLIIEGKYQFKPEMPFSPGGEVAGIVKEVGEGVSHLKPGDKVMSGTGWGGFAEEVKAMASNVFPIPPKMDFVTAASSMMTYGTSYHALVNRAELKSGETLLVLGAAGGVGTAAIQIAKNIGATVIAAASSDEKLEYCKSIGADFTINYSKEDLKERGKELTNGKGVDVIYDPVGDKYTEPALRTIAWKGRYLVVGFAAGDIPKIPLNLPLLKGCQIVGVFWGGFFRNEPQKNAENFMTIARWFAEGKLIPQIHAQYPLEKVAEAMNALTNKEVMGKVVLVP